MLYNKISFKELVPGPTSDRKILRLTQWPTWLGKLLGKKPRTLELIGRSTVWYFAPSGDRAAIRAGTCWESAIVNLLETAIYEEKIQEY